MDQSTPRTASPRQDDPPNPSRKSLIRLILWTTVGLLAVGVLGSLAVQWFFYELMWAGPNRGDAVNRACRLARLAPVPGEVIWSENRHNLFAGSTYVVFRATRADIEKWIVDSPGMNGLSPTVFDANLRLEPPSDDPNFTPHYDPKVQRESVYTQDGNYLPSTKNGARYKIPQDKDANYGTVIIDWDTGTVWIRASHS